MKATVEEDMAFAMWERRIDGVLSTHSGRSFVDGSIPSRVRERLMGAYRKAGWAVTYHDDQRDGASLEFT